MSKEIREYMRWIWIKLPRLRAASRPAGAPVPASQVQAGQDGLDWKHCLSVIVSLFARYFSLKTGVAGSD
jgi:hypothetical protein